MLKETIDLFFPVSDTADCQLNCRATSSYKPQEYLTSCLNTCSSPKIYKQYEGYQQNDQDSKHNVNIKLLSIIFSAVVFSLLILVILIKASH